MNDEVKSFISVIDALKDDARIKKSTGLLEEVAWQVNQCLTPESLNLITASKLKALFMMTAMRYVNAVKETQNNEDVAGKVEQLRNTAIGGGWI